MGSSTTGPTRQRKARARLYDQRSQRFACPNRDCNAVFYLGLVAWPVWTGPRGTMPPPEDVLPTVAEARGLRAVLGGVVAHGRKSPGAADPARRRVNVALQAPESLLEAPSASQAHPGARLWVSPHPETELPAEALGEGQPERTRTGVDRTGQRGHGTGRS